VFCCHFHIRGPRPVRTLRKARTEILSRTFRYQVRVCPTVHGGQLVWPGRSSRAAGRRQALAARSNDGWPGAFDLVFLKKTFWSIGGRMVTRPKLFGGSFKRHIPTLTLPRALRCPCMLSIRPAHRAQRRIFFRGRPRATGLAMGGGCCGERLQLHFAAGHTFKALAGGGGGGYSFSNESRCHWWPREQRVGMGPSRRSGIARCGRMPPFSRNLQKTVQPTTVAYRSRSPFHREARCGAPKSHALQSSADGEGGRKIH